MIEFGKTLRAARETKGLTVGQVAEQTHMMVQTVEGLENENFSKIVAPIYGRGFVKLYCEAVGLDPKPMIDAFTEIYADRHATSTKSRPETPAAAPLEAPAPVQADSAEPAAEEPPPKHAELGFGIQRPSAKAPLSRYAGTLPSDSEHHLSLLSLVNWRIVALAAGAFLVLLFVALGIRAIYRATMHAPKPAPVEETPSKPEATPAEQAAASAKPQAAKPQEADVKPQAPSRKPLPLKPFYIDSDHSTDNERSK